MRIQYLDGLRGVAILLVVLFHAYSRWPAMVPYGNAYATFPLFYFGWLGVQLFFLISGFVILMTLEKTPNFFTFIYKRWLRLFPAMCLVSFIIYFSSHFFSERPAGLPSLISLLPGLTFVELEWWEFLLRVPIIPLEGSFWSLYVEFKFYVVAAFVYYVFGSRYLVPVLVFLFLFSIFVHIIHVNFDNTIIEFVKNICNQLSFRHFGWFSSGALFYLYYKENNNFYFYLAIILSLISSVVIRNKIDFNITLVAFFVSLIFALSFKFRRFQSFLENKFLLLFGFVSYPLYLIHENLIISMIVKMSKHFPLIITFFYPIMSIFILLNITYFISYYLEPRFRNIINKLIYDPIMSLISNVTHEVGPILLVQDSVEIESNSKDLAEVRKLKAGR
jgi:peptidoglycan/LPS O-acetylase OafA/YrhL